MDLIFGIFETFVIFVIHVLIIFGHFESIFLYSSNYAVAFELPLLISNFFFGPPSYYLMFKSFLYHSVLLPLSAGIFLWSL